MLLCVLCVLLFPVRSEYHSFDSISQVGNVEVDQQADVNSAEAHVGQELCLMNRMDRVNAFNLDNHGVFNHEVHPKPQFDLLAFIDDRQADLRGYPQSTCSEFMCQARLIDTFEQPRSKYGVDLHGCTNYDTSELVDARLGTESGGIVPR